MNSALHHIGAVLGGVAPGLLVGLICVLLGFAVERVREARPRGLPTIAFNLVYAALSSVLQSLLQPVTAALTGLILASAGYGLIALPDHGWRLLPAVAVYVLAMDFGEYVFHRAQHRFPVLWAMHSLHHSDPDMNISTTNRHFWAEHGVKSLTTYLAVALMFKTNIAVVAGYGLVGFYNYVVHMRLRMGYGRFSPLLNAPLYHRVHHSRRLGDENINFAALFPIFDVLFGSYRRPVPADFPPTGLASGETPAGLIEGMLWPFRALLARRPLLRAP